MQILFVVLAFALMVFASYLFVSDIERKHLQRNIKDVISYTEANIKADLLEPETILAGISETIREMILNGEDAEMVRKYIYNINNYMQGNQEKRLFGINGFYGFFEAFGGRFIIGDFSWLPPEGYVLQDRPWYQVAVDADGDIVYTQPYYNLASGEGTITFARRIFNEADEPLGIVCLNIYLDRINQHAINTQFAENGYGFLLDQNMELIAHPDTSLLGMRLRNVRSYIAAYEDELRDKGYIYELVTTDYRGIKSIVFLQKLQNGWYMGVVTPRDEYYRSTRNMALVLTVMGAALAVILITILLVLFSQMNKENEKSRSMAYWYNSILNAIPLPISVTDKDSNWTFINTAVEKILWITLEDAIGKPCSNWGASICNTEDCGIACARRGLKQTYFSHGDLSYRVDVTILKDINNKPIGYIEILQDITDLKLMAKKQADAEAANSAKSAFLAKVSHEIRTPMNAILGITEIQLRNEELPFDTQEALEKIYNSGYLLLGIINDILDLSKIESGKLELFPIEYDVPSLINDTVNLNVVRYESKPITFTLHVDENIPITLSGDELRIKQILNNLLSNAFKYTASGNVSMSVVLDTRQEETAGVTLVFRVSDTGQGMTSEQVDKLFDEYTRFNTEINRAVEGAGLGMSITKQLIRLMNGEILVESEPGKGSIFTVSLPQGTVAGSKKIGREAAEKIGKMSSAGTSHTKKAPIVYEYMPYGRVLVVDDVETNLYVTRGLMTPYGLSVETAASGYEVIEKVKDGLSWDIIFMDHFMPGMDGIEAAKIIRGLGYTRPIVALTANVITGQAEMFFANGFDDFISKPIDIRQLNAVLNKLIRDKYPAETVEAARKARNSMGKSSSPQPSSNTEIAKIFIRDAEKAIAVLEAIHKKLYNFYDYTNEDMRSYVINVHSMKSALANIGETELSGVANKLEEAGRGQKITIMSNETPSFLSALHSVIEKIKPNKDGVGNEAGIKDDDRAFLFEKLAVIQKACAEYDKKTAKNALSQIRQKKWPNKTEELLDKIAEHLLHSEFGEAATMAENCKNI
jgi:signal transduction histidine kinase/CheY-like chemotaxis protein/HPt (histidine-containing phosphotransfer) domain-containing protein